MCKHSHANTLIKTNSKIYVATINFLCKNKCNMGSSYIFDIFVKLAI